MELKKATTDNEILTVLKLRYQIYVQEMQVYVSEADHEQGVLTDDRDLTDRLLYAEVDGEVVGAISLTIGADAPIDQGFETIFNLERFSRFIPETGMSVATRLVVKPEYRSTSLSFKLMAEASRVATEAGVQLMFCTCQPHLLKMYNRIGFRSYNIEIYNDPQFGIMIPLVLMMGDAGHLNSIRSPMRNFFAAGTYDTAALPKVMEAMGTAMVHEMTKDEMNQSVDLGENPHPKRVLFFEGLSEEEMQEVIGLGHVFECHAGDRVIKQGQVTKTVYVPLSGYLEVKQKNRLVALVQTGEILGEQAFLLDSRRTADVYAGAGGVKILSIDDRNLNQLTQKAGRLAALLLMNISKSLALRLARTTMELSASEMELQD